MPKVGAKPERRTIEMPNGVTFVSVRCFRPEDGQKSERWMRWPLEAFTWFRANVRVEEATLKRAYKLSWLGPTRLRCHGNHDRLCEFMRDKFAHLYDGLSRKIPFRREEVLGFLNHLRMTPMITNENPNPNRDPTPNPARLTRVVGVPGATSLVGYRRPR